MPTPELKPSGAWKQYAQIKSQYTDAVLMFQVGDFYETFDEDAKIAANELQIVLTSRPYVMPEGVRRYVPLAGIPLHSLEHHVGKLIQRGYKVAVCDQIGEAGKGVVDRAVTRILTAGTLSEPNLLPARQNNYLVAIAHGRTQTGLAAVDVSTGEFLVTWLAPGELPVSLDAELQRLAPAECLLVEGSKQESYHFASSSVTITHCPHYFFQVEAAQARLCRHFGVQSLDAYGCAGESQAIAAAGAIIAYLEKMNVALLSLLTGLRSYQTTSYMVLDAHTQRNLELLQGTRSGTLQGSLLSVLDRTVTAMGARQLRRTLTQPLLDIGQLDARLTAVEELYESPALRSRFVMCLQAFGDLERITARVRYGSAVRNELFSMRDNLELIPQLRMLLMGCTAPMLHELSEELDACPQVVELVDRALMRSGEEDEQGDDTRMIRASFHAELDELYASIRDSRRWMVSLEARERERTGMKKLKVGFNKVFGYYIEVTNSNIKLVPPDYMRKQTLVNAERFITPELKEHESRILSATERIEEMEKSIYADVLRQISMYYQELATTARAIAKLDVLLSLAEVAAHQGYTRPVLEQGHRLEIVAARHPVVEYALDGDVFIPNDTHLEGDEGERIVLLTGPNMAGKSTYLRQVALITLMAQIGSFVPAKSACIGLVDRIFTRVGAEDDIASGKSTFMVEMEETAMILHHATRHSLIILDEIGRGTSTYDGLAIARAVVEHLHRETGARTLFATHYHELAAMADELPHLRPYTMEISGDDKASGENQIVFLHRVKPGCTGRSYGVHVARLAGMPAGVVKRAEAVLKALELQHSENGDKNGYQLTDADKGRRRFSDANRLQPEMVDQRAALVEGVQSTLSIPSKFPGQQLTTASATSINGHLLAEQPANYEWQSEEARQAAEAWADGADIGIETIDVVAITPLDALNLLFLMQKRNKKRK